MENITEIIQLSNSLGEAEKKLMKILRKVSAVLPAELAVKSFLLPEEINKTLRLLKEKELINIERGASLPTGEVVYLNERGRMAAQFLNDKMEM